MISNKKSIIKTFVLHKCLRSDFHDFHFNLQGFPNRAKFHFDYILEISRTPFDILCLFVN